jgi:uncharacterized membrane protein
MTIRNAEYFNAAVYNHFYNSSFLQFRTYELNTKAKVFGCLIRRIQPHKGFEPLWGYTRKLLLNSLAEREEVELRALGAFNQQ